VRHVRSLPAATLLLLVATLARAAWLGPSGTPVAPTFHGQPVALFRDGGSGVFVAYQGLGVPGGQSIRLQHVLEDGTIAPGMPAQGTVACSLATITQLGELRAIPDGANGAYLFWTEGVYRVSGMYYVQHVLADGKRAPGWPARGRLVSSVGSLTVPQAVADGTGGLFVIWPGGGGAYSMRILADGTNAPGFSAVGRQVLTQPEPFAQWSGLSIAHAQGGGYWLSGLLASADSLATPWSYRLWRIDGNGIPDFTWAGDDGQGVRIPAASSALASGSTSVLDDGVDGALILMQLGAREMVAHVLGDQSLDDGWPEPLLDLGANVGEGAGPQGLLAPDGTGGLYALWPQTWEGTDRSHLRRVHIDGTLDPAWASEIEVSAGFLPTLLADASGVFATGARFLACPHQDCLALNGLGRWSADGSTPVGWPASGTLLTSPGEYALPDSAWAGVVSMVRDGAGGVFVAWTTPDVPPTGVPYGVAATVRVMRFQAAGPVAGVDGVREGPLSIRGTRFTRDGIRCSVAGGSSELAEATVFDVFGRRVTRAQIHLAAPDQLIPGTRALASGLYLVRVRTQAAEAHAKVFAVH
jgi:hypothetical protein